MNATIYHNPFCSTSRKTLAILRRSGAMVTVIEYLNSPPHREELRRLFRRAGISPRQGLRDKEPVAQALGLAHCSRGGDPILINRPLVETDKGVRLCRPEERVREIL